MNDRQVPLGVAGEGSRAAAEAAAEALFSRADRGEPAPAAPAPPPPPEPPPQPPAVSDGETVAAAVADYLAATAARSKTTHSGARHYCKLVLARFGTKYVTNLSVDAVQAWADGLPVGPDSRRNLLTVCEAVLKRAGRPVRFQKPPRGSRGEQAVIPERVYQQAVGAARGDLRAMLQVLWETGARPGELRQLTAGQVDWQAGQAVISKHKTAHRTGRKRLVPLSAAALKVLAGQREKYGGTGLLFRTRTGGAFTLPGLTQAVWRVGRRIGHPGLTAYGFRHTLATRALRAGVPDTHVAAVLGHSGTAMIHKHYSHLSQNARLLKDVVDKLSKGRRAG